MIYLDNSATTFPKPESVYKIIDESSRNAFNAGRGTYEKSRKATETINKAREEIASFVNTSKDQTIFTASATEALNTIINGISLAENDEVYVTPFEHNATIRSLVSKKVKINIIPFDEETWEINLKKIDDMFAMKQPKAVFVSQISNVTGYEPDYGTIFAHSSRYNAINVLDAAQGYGIVPIQTKSVNYIVFAGHKSLYGTFGVGGFIKLLNDDLRPFLYGGTGSDSLNLNMPSTCPEKFEAGSHNILAISSILEGAKWIKTQNIENYERDLTKYLIDKLKTVKGVRLFVPKNEKVVGIVSFAIEGYSSDEIASILDDDFQICVRAGYHCAPYVHDFIHSKNYQGTVRASISAFTTQRDIDTLIKALNSL